MVSLRLALPEAASRGYYASGPDLLGFYPGFLTDHASLATTGWSYGDPFPADWTRIVSLEYYTCFVTEEDPAEVFDHMTVSLLDSSGNTLEVLAEYTNKDAGTGCNFRRENLLADNAHAGQEIRLELFGLNDEAGLTSFYFDTLALTATCP